MSDRPSVAMTTDEITRFLDARGTCVLSLAEDDEPYAIPVSYGYDASEECFYLRLGHSPESEKQAFLQASERARIVVYDQTPEGWKSVVATGVLTELDEADLTAELIAQLSDAELPRFEMWDESKRELDFTINRLDVETLTGRKAVSG